MPGTSFSNAAGPQQAAGSSSGAAGSRSTALGPCTFADRSAIRRTSAPRKSSSIAVTYTTTTTSGTAAKPLHLSWFEAHFGGGEHGFFSHLAEFRNRHPHPPLSASAHRSLLRVIELEALMRIAIIRNVELCDHCSHPSVSAPFCAVPPHDIQPAGTRQHANSRSQRCLLLRTLNGLSATPHRIRLLFGDSNGQLRVARDTDDRGKPMLMLADYARTLWNATLVLGMHAVAADIKVVLHAHGLLHITSAPPQQHLDDLCEQFTALAHAAPPTQARAHDAEVQTLARLHVAIFGADFADYAMQAIMVALHPKLGSTAAVAPPPSWLVESAVRVHAQYEPEEYTAPDGSVVRVQRDHTRTQAMFTRWIERTFPGAPPRAPDTVPTRRSREPEQQELDDGPRPAQKRARSRAVVESDDDMDLDSDTDEQQESQMQLDPIEDLGWNGDAMDQDPPTPEWRLQVESANDQAVDALADTSMDTASSGDDSMPLFIPDERAGEIADAMMVDTALVLARSTATFAATPTLPVEAQRRRRAHRQLGLVAVAMVVVYGVGFYLGRRSAFANMARKGAHFVNDNLRAI